ncbi:MAG: XRE family transcriptional regulator [Sphingobacteriales bacterium]|nr:MAG: XRE family transcriptional regulator [Sphingobacteriales bacterium]
MDKKIHHGRNIKRLREVQGIKQDTLAADLGEDWTQKKVSLLEGKEEIEADLLQKVAHALKIPVSAIENLDDDDVVNIISNTFNDNSSSQGAMGNYGTFNINTGEKWLEALEENKKLYERLLQAEREKVDLLQKLLDKK